MFARALREHALEEGGVGRATLQSFARAAREWGRHAGPAHRRRATCYAATLAWLAVCVAARPGGVVAGAAAAGAGTPPAPPPPAPPQDPAELAAVYGRLRATPVAPGVADDDPLVTRVVARVRAAMRAFNYSCLCATHIGIPVQVAVVGNDTVLVNPRRGPPGAKVSTALETSAFYPKRRPKRMTRFLPATVFVRDQDQDDDAPRVFANRAEAHCVQHLLDQMLDGLSPYDIGGGGGGGGST
jgi:peptide deformylase